MAEAFDFHQDLRKLTHGQVRLFFLRVDKKKPQMRFHLTLTLHLLDTYFDHRAVSVRARPNTNQNFKLNFELNFELNFHHRAMPVRARPNNKPKL